MHDKKDIQMYYYWGAKKLGGLLFVFQCKNTIMYEQSKLRLIVYRRGHVVRFADYCGFIRFIKYPYCHKTSEFKRNTLVVSFHKLFLIPNVFDLQYLPVVVEKSKISRLLY